MNVVSNSVYLKSRIGETAEFNSPPKSNVYFFTEDAVDLEFSFSLTQMTKDYSSHETWNAIKTALECGSSSFTEEDAIFAIHSANDNFPTKNDQLSFDILSVISLFLQSVVKDSYELLSSDESFLHFFLKLPDCFNQEFERRSILACADIIGCIMNAYDPKKEVDDSIIFAFRQIQKSIIELIGSYDDPSFFNTFSIALLMPLLEKMIIITEEEDINFIFEFFFDHINPDISVDISNISAEACFSLLTDYSESDKLTIEWSEDYLNKLIDLLNQEFTFVQFAAKILIHLISRENGFCNVLLELDIGVVLLESFQKLIESQNTYSYYIFKLIDTICEASDDGCIFFMDSNLLLIPELNDSSFKINILTLRIINRSLELQHFPQNEETIQLTIIVAEKCLVSEEPDILLKALKVIRFLHTQEIEISEDIMELLEDLSFNSFDKEISNEAAALVNLIKEN